MMSGFFSVIGLVGTCASSTEESIFCEHTNSGRKFYRSAWAREAGFPVMIHSEHYGQMSHYTEEKCT